MGIILVKGYIKSGFKCRNGNRYRHVVVPCIVDANFARVNRCRVGGWLVATWPSHCYDDKIAYLIGLQICNECMNEN